MDENYQMSPLRQLILSVLRWGTYGATGLLVLFAGILLLQRRTTTGAVEFQQGDLAFLGVLAALLVLAVYLMRGIARELNRPGD